MVHRFKAESENLSVNNFQEFLTTSPLVSRFAVNCCLDMCKNACVLQIYSQ